MSSISNYRILDGTFFKLVKQEEKGGIIATCIRCAKQIKGQLGSTGNFKSHLSRVHGLSVLKEYEDYSKTPKTRELQSEKKRLKLMDDYVMRADSVNTFEELLTDFVVNGMHSFSIVEEPSFVALIQGVSKTNTAIMSRRTLARHVEKKFEDHMVNLQLKLQEQKHICTTAEIRSMPTRSFLGVTAHYIEQTNDGYERKSAAIACDRMKGTHDFQAIAEKMEDVYVNMGISMRQIVATVTDNGSNFVKAFREYGIEFQRNEDDDAETGDYSPEIDFLETEGLVLPQHLRCAAHTLSLVAVTDTKKAMASRAYFSALGKASALWNMGNRPKTAEIIQEVLGCRIQPPCPTRWNSLFDAVKKLMLKKKELNIVASRLGLPPFKEQEIELLEEYIMLLCPIATAIDRLQAEKNHFYGELAPTIFKIYNELKNMKMEHVKLSNNLLDALIAGLSRRFKYILNCSSASQELLATFSHPFFKTRWLAVIGVGNSITEKLAADVLIAAARRLHETESPLKPQLKAASNQQNDYFGFTEQPIGKQKVHREVPSEVYAYLADPETDLKMLQRYPLIENVFLEYNTPLCSSAPVERLFSFAGMITYPKRRGLSDKTVRILTLLKNNK